MLLFDQEIQNTEYLFFWGIRKLALEAVQLSGTSNYRKRPETTENNRKRHKITKIDQKQHIEIFSTVIYWQNIHKFV